MQTVFFSNITCFHRKISTAIILSPYGDDCVCETDLNSECQGNPEVPYYHPSTAWRKLAPLLDHQSLVSTLKPHLYLYSLNQGQLLDADWWSDVVLTARQTEKQRDDNQKDGEMDRWWVDSFSARKHSPVNGATYRLMDSWPAKYSRCWKISREFNKRPGDNDRRSTCCYPIPKDLFGKYAC